MGSISTTELTKRFLLRNCSTFWSIMLANAAFSSWPSFPFLAYEHLFLLKSNWWLKYSWCDTVRISPCFGYLYGDYSSVHTSLYNFISVIRSIGMHITYLKIALNNCLISLNQWWCGSHLEHNNCELTVELKSNKIIPSGLRSN